MNDRVILYYRLLRGVYGGFHGELPWQRVGGDELIRRSKASVTLLILHSSSSNRDAIPTPH
jgi:hypothetical protein